MGAETSSGSIRDSFKSDSGGFGPEHISCLSRNAFIIPDHLVQSAWLEHAPFLFWLMGAFAPRNFVELGTHTGYSYFAACQIVRNLGLATSCFAVDTWQGDEHAGFYDDSIYQNVVAANRRYESTSRLIRSDFVEAVKDFSDSSIDLLHIDGRHFYEDAKSDFELWRPKISENGIVLFHDTQVREREFGVWRLFGELSGTYQTFEFRHCNGLGVLAVGAVPIELRPLFLASEEEAETVRSVYSSLGSNISARWKAREALAELSHQNRELESELAARRDSETRRLAAKQKPLSGVILPKSLNDLGARLFGNRHLRRDYITLARSFLFDGDWYLAEYPKVATEEPDPILHYLKYGGEFVGLSPSAHFDARRYVLANPDVEATKQNPLLHFLRVGASELRPLRPSDPALTCQ